MDSLTLLPLRALLAVFVTGISLFCDCEYTIKRLEYQPDMNDLIAKGKKLLNSQQNTVLSAATLIMTMIIASRILGLVRQRVLANYFAPSDLSLFFAAFRLPDAIFEVLVFGTFSSAFIPVFTKALREGQRRAWEIAGRVVTIGLLVFGFTAIILAIWAPQIYSVIAPGYKNGETAQIANLARILFAAQGFFVISYVLTGVLESLRRFLVPALAPLFYNIGIILGTVLLTPYLGLLAPAVGVVIGAFAHFMVQFPLSRKLGFRFVWDFKPDVGVKKVGILALPRVIDLTFDQVGKTTELFLSSLISQASYTYYIFANTLQLLPVTLFGTSLAKAVLPLLSRADGNLKEYRRILLTAIFQAIFFTLPLSIALIILRIPIVRLVYGTKIFDWEATVQTGMVLSVYAVGIVSQTLMSILARAFFALHDTKTPVKISFIGLGLLIAGDFLLVKGFGLPVWALAASFSFSTIIEAVILSVLIHKKVGELIGLRFFGHLSKIFVATVISGFSMFFLIKFFDRWYWLKQVTSIPFEKFVLDTRYAGNLLILTVVTFLIGMAIYIGVSLILKVAEAGYFLTIVKRLITRRMLPRISDKEQEPVSPTTTDTQEQ
ncbi:MAG: Integral membrane protein MviN [Candidatus Woesebacteria bacterium GW2011_GWB1_39_10]|uniref:Probable lipid II flippase MurJ n=3 Tax=Candidatus Woeseibacteriota TaxID=1752722 RepID=A0A0G0LJP4_9BACT|nr:MAG: Integral membrane protein MviN [Candidatus Woesebacteria bacterium GW2011_GWB1_39_10]KKS91073.1 MAG: Integral membrane protein MviN [Candidatus Woesebacteria bacterium GW2011_GWA1_43_12]